jgi:hypothetical protein
MRALIRAAGALVVVLGLAGCAAEAVWAPEEEVQPAAYRPGGTPSVSLLTMVSNRSGEGAHSALIIDGAQRVLFDPAGSWYHPMIPERNDVLYGMSPQFLDFYMDYHARETFHVVVQELDISPQAAAAMIATAQSIGPVPNAQCSLAVGRVLSSAPGFDTVGSNLFPATTMRRFAELPGVREQRIYDDDSDDNLELLQAQARAAQIREAAGLSAGDD